MNDFSLREIALLPTLTVEECHYRLATRGYCLVPDFLPEAATCLLRARLAKSLNDYRPIPGNAQSELDRYLLHDLLCQDIGYGRLLEDPRLQQLIAPLLGEHWIMYAYTSSSLPPQGSNYGRRIHVDSPRFVPSYPFNIGLLWTLDAFTAENGGTQVLPGSHHSPETPSAGYFDSNCTAVQCAAGSLLVFNARLFHRSGFNQTPHWRHSLTMNACRSFMKQRMDWVRFIPAAIAERLDAQARRLIGFDTRLPASLNEFFAPEDARLYKPGQG